MSQTPLKHAIVTGAGRGIGREIALRLAHDGYSLALMARNHDQLDSVSEHITAVTAAAVRVTVIPVDLSNTDAARNAAKLAATVLGGIDTLINGAGISGSSAIQREDVPNFMRMMTVNALAPFVMMREVITGMKEKKYGRIVNIASVAGLRGYPYIAAYAASKHALVGITRCAAAELADSGITVNAICPGYVDTDMTEVAIKNIARATNKTEDQARAQLAAFSPQNRLFTATEVAAATLFLLSPEAKGINGQCIPICGGELV